MYFYALISRFGQQPIQEKTSGIVNPLTACKNILLLSDVLSPPNELQGDCQYTAKYKQFSGTLTRWTEFYNICLLRIQWAITINIYKVKLLVDQREIA